MNFFFRIFFLILFLNFFLNFFWFRVVGSWGFREVNRDMGHSGARVKHGWSWQGVRCWVFGFGGFGVLGVFLLSSQSALIELRLYKSNVSANFDPEGAKQAPQSVSGARRGRR